MDALKLHLLINYYPAIGMFFGTLLLFGGFIRRSDRLKYWSLIIFIAVALLAIIVFETGEIAGAVEGGYAGVPPESLQNHRVSARPAFIGIIASGIASLTALFLLKRNSEYSQKAFIAVLVFSIITCGLILRTTYLGRQVKWAGATPTDLKPANVKRQPGL